LGGSVLSAELGFGEGASRAKKEKGKDKANGKRRSKRKTKKAKLFDEREDREEESTDGEYERNAEEEDSTEDDNEKYKEEEEEMNNVAKKFVETLPKEVLRPIVATAYSAGKDREKRRNKQKREENRMLSRLKQQESGLARAFEQLSDILGSSPDHHDRSFIFSALRSAFQLDATDPMVVQNSQQIAQLIDGKLGLLFELLVSSATHTMDLGLESYLESPLLASSMPHMCAGLSTLRRLVLRQNIRLGEPITSPANSRLWQHTIDWNSFGEVVALMRTLLEKHPQQILSDLIKRPTGVEVPTALEPTQELCDLILRLNPSRADALPAEGFMKLCQLASQTPVSFGEDLCHQTLASGLAQPLMVVCNVARAMAMQAPASQTGPSSASATTTTTPTTPSSSSLVQSPHCLHSAAWSSLEERMVVSLLRLHCSAITNASSFSAEQRVFLLCAAATGCLLTDWSEEEVKMMDVNKLKRSPKLVYGWGPAASVYPVQVVASIQFETCVSGGIGRTMVEAMSSGTKRKRREGTSEAAARIQ